MITENIPGRYGFSLPRAFQRWSQNCRSTSDPLVNYFFLVFLLEAQSYPVVVHFCVFWFCLYFFVFRPQNQAVNYIVSSTSVLHKKDSKISSCK